METKHALNNKHHTTAVFIDTPSEVPPHNGPILYTILQNTRYVIAFRPIAGKGFPQIVVLVGWTDRIETQKAPGSKHHQSGKGVNQPGGETVLIEIAPPGDEPLPFGPRPDAVLAKLL